MISKNFKKRIITSCLLLLLVILIARYNIALVFTLIVLGALSLIEFFNISNKIFKNKIYLSIINLLFSLYLFLFCFMFFFYSNYLQTKIILFIILLGCVASDIGGYLFGKFFKGPKLTKISPNKTYSGVLGSIILSMLIFSILIFYFTNNLNFKILLYAISTSVACQLGDLFFSLIKRKAKIKDTGSFLPGHGGILDRIDGMLVGIPVGFISMIIF